MLNRTSPATLADDAPVTRDAQYFEYTSSANPIGAKLISRVPFRTFSPSLYAQGPTRTVPLDLSAELGCPSPATGPSLSASFLRIDTGEELTLEPTATSQVCYVINGMGSVMQGATTFPFAQGDFFTLPGGEAAVLSAHVCATLYYVNDAPLLTYLGVTGVRARFAPTLYPAARARAELRKVAQDANAGRRAPGQCQFPPDPYRDAFPVGHVRRGDAEFAAKAASSSVDCARFHCRLPGGLLYAGRP